MAFVEVKNVSKRFGETPVLSGVDVFVKDGGFAVLVGPSGCGKSTLLRLLAGLEECDEGAIRFGDRDVTRLAPRERDVAMVFQSYALYPHLTVRKNLSFGLELKKTGRAEIDRRIRDVSEMLGLEELLDRLPKALSGGQRQRVAMGRAIVRRPSLFLFDEPLSNLDAALRAQVRVDIRKLHDRLGATSVYVTHDQVEAMTLADEIFVMHGGVVEQSGAPLDVYDRPATKFVASFLGSPAMNFIDAELVTDGDDTFVVAADLRAPVDAVALGGAGRRLEKAVVGIRPHDVRIAREGEAAAIETRVDVVEALGAESFAHARVAGAPFVARFDGGVGISVGSPLRLIVAPERLHLFDPESGHALFRG